MPTTNELDARLRAVEAENAEQRGSRSASKDWRNYVSAGALMLAAWTVYGVHRLEVQVSSLNTLVTGKVSELALSTATSSPIQAIKGYTTVSAILQDSADHKRPVAPSTVDTLAKTLAQQERTNSGLPEYWVLTGQLIDAKTQPIKKQDPESCLTSFPDHNPATPVVEHPNRPIMEDYVLKNCTLRLDDPAYDQSWIAENVRRDLKIWPSAEFNYVLENVTVTYAGGPLIPITTIRFVNCTFDLKYTTVPADAPARKLGLQLLTANLLEPVFTVRLAPA